MKPRFSLLSLMACVALCAVGVNYYCQSARPRFATVEEFEKAVYSIKKGDHSSHVLKTLGRPDGKSTPINGMSIWEYSWMEPSGAGNTTGAGASRDMFSEIFFIDDKVMHVGEHF
jgi:hypothetical protein